MRFRSHNSQISQTDRTAAHVVVGVTFPSQVTIKSITLSVNGSTSSRTHRPPCGAESLQPVGAAQHGNVSVVLGRKHRTGRVREARRPVLDEHGGVLTGTATYGDDNQTRWTL